FIQRQKDRVALRTDEFLHGGEHPQPLVPGFGRRCKPGLAQQVAAIEQQPCIDVPGHAVQDAGNAIRLDETLEVIIQRRDARCLRCVVQRFERSSAACAVNAAIDVLPGWQRSGSVPPAYAVKSFSCAAVHGSFCTSTRICGCSASKSRTNSAAISPSRPTAQNRTTLRRSA